MENRWVNMPFPIIEVLGDVLLLFSSNPVLFYLLGDEIGPRLVSITNPFPLTYICKLLSKNVTDLRLINPSQIRPINRFQM